MCVCTREHACTYVVDIRGQLGEIGPFLGPRVGTQVARLGTKCLYPFSHLASPCLLCYFFFNTMFLVMLIKYHLNICLR